MARLVRCPKCQKFLVEYPNVPVYQCGGCGIALRAKNHSDSRVEKLITESSQINQPESQSDVGFSDSESFSSPFTITRRRPKLANKPEENSSPTSNLDDHPRAEDRNQQVDFVEETVDQDENEPVKLTNAEEQTPRVAARSIGSEEDMAERLQYEGIRHAYYDGSISSSDEAQSVQCAERKSAKSRRTVKAASNSDVKLHSGSVRSAASSLPAMTRFNAARDRASSSKGSSFDTDEFQVTAENWSGLPKDSSFDADEFQITAEDWRALSKGSSSGELHGKVALLRKIDEVREQLVKISVASERRDSRGIIHGMQSQLVHQITPKLNDPDPQSFASAAISWSSGSRRKPDPIKKRPMHHCRPVSGAAPFVICGNCTKLLQLPADFLSTRRRRLYKLRCAGCNAVLDLPFPAKDGSFSEADPAPIEAGDELNSGGKGVARGNLTSRLHRLMGYDSASDLLLAGEEVDKGHERMESTGQRGSNSSYHGNVRAGIPRPPAMK